jgi:hypothetical protein
MARFDQPIEPMTLGDTRGLGVRWLDVSCWNCHHREVLSADRWPDEPSPCRRLGHACLHRLRDRSVPMP